jgi:hypothetical protein
MTRRQRDPRQEFERLLEQRYQYDLAKWTAWLQEQDRLQALLPTAVDVLAEALTGDGPEATKLALALVKLSGLARPMEKPDRLQLDFADPDELQAGLPDHDDGMPVLPENVEGQ